MHLACRSSDTYARELLPVLCCGDGDNDCIAQVLKCFMQTASGLMENRTSRLVAVVVHLEWTANVETEVLGLDWSKAGDLDVEG